MRTLYLVCALAYFFVTNAWSDPVPAGTVKTVSGEAFITTAGTPVRAALGTPVYVGSQLKTGAKGSLGVVFNDATVMSFGADTTFTIDDYAYAPDNGQHKFASKLVKGSLGYLSGAIAKLKPQAVGIQTSTGTLGVRGTHLLAVDVGLNSYVTLIADPDGKVGQVVVQGTRGTQLLQTANTSAPLNGSAAPYASDPAAIQQQFADVLNARPVQPPLPSLSQGAAVQPGTSGMMGAGAQAGSAAAVGGVSAPLVTLGVVAAGVAIDANKGSTGTTGSR